MEEEVEKAREKKGKGKKILLGFLTVVAIAGVGGAVAGIVFKWTSRQADLTRTEAPEASVEEVVPAPSLSPSPTASASAKPVVKTDKELIAEALAEKHGKAADDVNVTISENTGVFARGGVSFEGEMGGGMWLAYKDGDEWIVVYDGNGTIPCESVNPPGFPVDMVSECWDSAAGVSVTR